MEYPGNSINKKTPPAPAPEPKVITPVVTGNVTRKKRSALTRFKETFIGGDAQSVVGYVSYEILIPAVKDTLSDMVSMGIERLLFGEGRISPSRRGRASGASTGHINYSGFSKSPTNRYGRDEPRQISRSARAAHNFDEIILDTRVEAETVIERLSDLCDQYGMASVSELYELVKITGDFTDEKWGWFDMRGARVDRIRGGYLLNLPKPEVLNN